MNLWTIFSEATLLNKIILLVLLLMSVMSWTVVIERLRYFRSALSSDKRFIKSLPALWEAMTLHKLSRKQAKSAIGRVYLAAERETEQLGREDAESWAEALEIESSELRSEAEKGLPVLAIVASASPFIGLLGTVWGVMIAFLRLGDLQGQPALEVVGPGIAEALIATAAGLFAAIPAVIAYNAFLSMLRGLMRRVSDFNRRLVVTIGSGDFGR